MLNIRILHIRIAGGIGGADALGSGLRAADLPEEPTFGTCGGMVHQGGLERHRHELTGHPAHHVRMGEDRLTGGAREHSAARVVDGPVDEDPEEQGLAAPPRLAEPFEEAALPRDLPPGDVGRLELLDLAE